MSKKHLVLLNSDEREKRQTLIQKGKTQGYRIKHAQVFLKLNHIQENREWIGTNP